MNAIDNIRRDLREASYLKYSPVPFAGAVHNFARPLRERFKSREHCGPYYFSPSKPGAGRGFYQAKNLACGDSTFRLRLEEANDYLRYSRLSNTLAYWCDDDGFTSLTPIIARLPRGRGFLAGWTMGANMLANVAGEIFETAEDAARAAHDMAEQDAERERDYRAAEEDESEDDDCEE